jgi:ATP-dependent DNA ligase
MPLDVPPPRVSRFRSPLTLSRVHWVRPELVAEIKFLSWTEDNLLRRSSTKVCRRTSRRRMSAARRHTRIHLTPAYGTVIATAQVRLINAADRS